MIKNNLEGKIFQIVWWKCSSQEVLFWCDLMTEGAILVWSLWSNIQGMDPKLGRSVAYSRNYQKAGVSEAEMNHIVADACILV